ncbi:MAG: amidohydrolase family protein, partial [Flavobacteriales bacterium]|nr:amidohydrolase family protein [Flavobacteriales bacterium]
INSDDAEMGRRLNQEAAKTVKYGGVSEEEAWKMVTLDPARMLKLDHRMGSVLPGMDADLVLWSEHPLSIRATVLRTYVDGACYFDADQEHGLHADASEERDRLVRAMILARKNGEPTMKATKEEEHLWHCDDLGDGTAEDAQ